MQVTDVEELTQFVGRKNQRDILVLGEGSNCVFLQNYQGTILSLHLLGKTIEECEDSYLVTANASENWHEFVVELLDNGIYGLENLALIPGTVGACPIQNIGAYGVEVNKFIEAVKYFDLNDGELKQLNNEACKFGYRDSIFKQELSHNAVIISVSFRFPKAWQPVVTYGELSSLQSPTAKDIFEKVVITRQQKLPDPKVLGNSGSFFKNPIVATSVAERIKQSYESVPIYPVSDDKVKLAAGWLIDQCGLKGFTQGGAAVHENQALVMVNKSGEATSEDLLNLLSVVIKKVQQKFEITLQTEVRLIGESGESEINLANDAIVLHCAAGVNNG